MSVISPRKPSAPSQLPLFTGLHYLYGVKLYLPQDIVICGYLPMFQLYL